MASLLRKHQRTDRHNTIEFAIGQHTYRQLDDSHILPEAGYDPLRVIGIDGNLNVDISGSARISVEGHSATPNYQVLNEVGVEQPQSFAEVARKIHRSHS